MSYFVNLHCPKCNQIVVTTHARLEHKERAELERAAPEAHRCAAYEPDPAEPEPEAPAPVGVYLGDGHPRARAERAQETQKP